ncbi:glycosyltransferase family 4 protein [Methylobacterium sp. C25]|uniref:glycosyltransferase family 4 protein n=1 Tax=Methylobacterium sp. C25 TaxID=2721622 RepID=UPI001F2CEF05|nr:glycosyltransferase family 4 protein [Methylobacterium sp. C25]
MLQSDARMPLTRQIWGRMRSPEAAPGVLIIVENLSVPFDRRAWAEALALREAGYKVSVICPKGNGFCASKECLDGIHIFRHWLPIASGGPLSYILEYVVALIFQLYLSFRIKITHGFDVIHACNPPDLIVLVAVLHKLLFRTKFIYDQHDLNPELFEVKFGRRGIFYKTLEVFERLSFMCADASIAMNETCKTLAIERGRMPAERVWTVKSYPELKTFRPVERDETLRGEFRQLVGWVGIMGEQDGVDILVRAAAHVVHTLGRTDIGFMIIGDGPEFKRMQALARQLQVENNVKFTGYISGESLLRHMSILDIGVIPDPPNPFNHHISMNKVFEYMAVGLPFVLFDLVQSKSEAGEAALIVDRPTPDVLANGIVTLLADAPARERMGRYGRRQIAHEFSWTNEKPKLLAAYRQVLGEWLPATDVVTGIVREQS